MDNNPSNKFIANILNFGHRGSGMVVEVGLTTPDGVRQSRHIGLDKVNVFAEHGNNLTTLSAVYRLCQDHVVSINQQQQGFTPLDVMKLFMESVLQGNKALINISGLTVTSSTYLPAVFIANEWSSVLDVRDWSAQLIHQNQQPVVFLMQLFCNFCATKLQAAKAAGEQSGQFLRTSQLQVAQQRMSVATASGQRSGQNMARRQGQGAQGVLPPQDGGPAPAAARSLQGITAGPPPTVTGMPGSGVQPQAVPARGSGGATHRGRGRGAASAGRGQIPRAPSAAGSPGPSPARALSRSPRPQQPHSDGRPQAVQLASPSGSIVAGACAAFATANEIPVAMPLSARNLSASGHDVSRQSSVPISGARGGGSSRRGGARRGVGPRGAQSAAVGLSLGNPQHNVPAQQDAGTPSPRGRRRTTRSTRSASLLSNNAGTQ